MRVKCSTWDETDNIFSDHHPVDYSIPQGSCLGPLLFLVFCNDLPQTLTFCNAILFADDTTLYKSHSNLRYLEWCLIEEMTQLLDWFRANKLTLNLAKSCCMVFSPNIKHVEKFKLEVDRIEIPTVNCTKFLGVW